MAVDQKDQNIFNLPKPKAILFDWDNTLVDSWACIHHALAMTFQAFEMPPWSMKDVQENVRYSGRDAFPKIFGEQAGQATKIYYEAFERDHLDKLRALEGAEDFLRLSAQALDIPLAVVSNKAGYLLRKEVAHLGWEKSFFPKSVVGATDAPRDKPAADPALLALSHLGISQGREVWFVGDTDVDLLCARESGCTSILIHATPSSKKMQTSIQEDYYAVDFQDLSYYLSKCATQ